MAGGLAVGPPGRRWRAAGRWVLIVVWLAAFCGWAVVQAGYLTSRAGVLAAGAVAATAAVPVIAPLPGRIRAITRLRRHGQLVDALIISMQEKRGEVEYEGVAIPRNFTTVTLCFTDASGNQITGQYTRRSAALAAERAGRRIQVVYDPRRPARFSPAAGDYRTAEFLYDLPAAACFLAMTAWLFFRALS